MTRRSRLIIIGTTTVLAIIVAVSPYLVPRAPLMIILPVSVAIALFGVVIALTSGYRRVALLILLLGAEMAALVYFVPGIRSSVVAVLSTEIDRAVRPW
jgi:hypothetical protein